MPPSQWVVGETPGKAWNGQIVDLGDVVTLVSDQLAGSMRMALSWSVVRVPRPERPSDGFGTKLARPDGELPRCHTTCLLRHHAENLLRVKGRPAATAHGRTER